MIRAPVNPELLSWARERARLASNDLVRRFPKLPEWENGTIRPTFKQTDDFASYVNVPVGYLFLSKPPTESLPIADNRAIAGTSQASPSIELLDVIRLCYERQTWFQDFVRIEELDVLPLVGSATLSTSPSETAREMRDFFKFGVTARQGFRSWSDCMRTLMSVADRSGILVMVSGIVACNAHRRLDPEEFSGFALSDPVAPLVFVNSSDTRAAQMFSLVHELAHIWLGSSAISTCQAATSLSSVDEERWCNAVSAEFLVPAFTLRAELRDGEPLPEALKRLTRIFKVTGLVLLRRMLEVGWLEVAEFESSWREEAQRVPPRPQRQASGGDFYRSLLSRVGLRFARALVQSTLEGQTLYRDAYRLLGVRRSRTFEEFARRIKAKT